MIIECQNCGKNFEDIYYKRFGTKNAVRIWCNECVDKFWRAKDGEEKIHT